MSWFLIFSSRIEEREKRMIREKERRLRDYDEGIKIQKEMEERIAASVLMQGYLNNLLPSVLEGLESEGFLTDSIRKDVDEGFMPWLMKEVTDELQEVVSSRDLLTGIDLNSILFFYKNASYHFFRYC